VLSKRFRRGCKRPAQHWFVNEVDSELEPMAARNVTQVVAELVLLLIAQVGEKRNRSSELVLAKSFETGDGQGRGTERKRQREAQLRVSSLGEMQQAGVENQIAKPV